MGDIEYFRKRLAEELALTASPAAENVRTVHQELAELYAERLARLGADTGRGKPHVKQATLVLMA